MLSSCRRSLYQNTQRVVKPVLILCTLLSLLFGAPAFADDIADVNKLMRSGQFADALEKVDAALVQRPRDPQLRFLKGLILTEQNKTSDAIIVFTKLTEEFPNLPEPYNNLAVLFAASNQYEKARAALEMAIRTNPTYGTAHENLGDVYAKLASQAYDKALQLDSGNSAAKSKLTMVRTLVGNPSGNVVPKTIVASHVSAPVAAPVVVAKAAPAKVEVKQVAKVEPKTPLKTVEKADSNSDRDDVLKAVNAWANAWSSKDVKTYLGVYGNDFQLPKGMSRTKWVEERRSRIEDKGRINVQVESPQIKVDGNSASVKFRQIYTSDRFKADSRKTLILEKQGGKWQIKQERAGN